MTEKELLLKRIERLEEKIKDLEEILNEKTYLLDSYKSQINNNKKYK